MYTRKHTDFSDKSNFKKLVMCTCVVFKSIGVTMVMFVS